MPKTSPKYGQLGMVVLMNNAPPAHLHLTEHGNPERYFLLASSVWKRMPKTLVLNNLSRCHCLKYDEKAESKSFTTATKFNYWLSCCKFTKYIAEFKFRLVSNKLIYRPD